MLSCQANGLPMPKVSWKRSETGDAVSTDSTKYDQRPLGDLVIRSVEAPADEGEYSCSAANVYGEVETRTRVEVFRRAGKGQGGQREVVANLVRKICLKKSIRRYKRFFLLC